MRLTLLTLILLLSFGSGARADVLVIVNADNPVSSLEPKQIIDLFMGRVRSFAGGRPAQTLDYVAGTPVRSHFFRTLTGKSEAQIDAYWATLIFAGRMPPPKQLANDLDVIEAVSANPAAVGYVSDHHTLPPSVKVIMALKADQ